MVIIKGETPKFPEHLPAYSLLGNNLYLPVNAELFPPVSDEELKKILLWQVQFFHPAIGLVGFEKSARVEMDSFIATGTSHAVKWNFARQGNPTVHPLQRISIEKTGEDILDLFKKDIEQKPLEDIPGGKPKDKSSGLLHKIADAAKFSGFSMLQKIGKILEGTDEDLTGKAIPGAGSQSPGFLATLFMNLFKLPAVQKINNWVNKSLEQLQREREDEIQRLLRMMEENPMEGLKYAIPLASDYAPRGTAQPSSKLSLRDTNFNLRGLGGGRAGDSWSIDKYYAELRTKYMRAAQDAVNKKDFKRAAYIYAHLLRDFNSAANVLQQGKMYREAAVIYKDHLKNKPAAAECLEKGGLLNDAIDLYIELDRDEKAGDLYGELGQQENSEKYYLRSIQKHIACQDYIYGAKLYKDKMKQPEPAKALLLQGWNKNIQSEKCLVDYFQIVRENKKANISEEINEIYQLHTPVDKRTSFLHAMVNANKFNATAEEHATTEKIAYEVVSQQIKAGELNNALILSQFVAGDHLLPGDLGRFVYNERTAITQGQRFKKCQLRKDVAWIRAYSQTGYFYALGYTREMLVFCRANWSGDADYAYWNSALTSGNIRLIARPYSIEKVMLYTPEGYALEPKYLQPNTYASRELSIDSPAWLPRNALGITINSYGLVAVLVIEKNALLLCEYTVDGKLQNSVICKNSKGELHEPDVVFNLSGDMVYRNNHYCIILNNAFTLISRDGVIVAPVIMESYASRFAVSDRMDRLEVLVASTENAVNYIEWSIQTNERKSEKLASPTRYDSTGIEMTHPIVDMKFLPGNYIAVSTKKLVEIYKLSETENEKPHLTQRIETENGIVTLLTTNDQNKIAILLDDGKIELQEIS